MTEAILRHNRSTLKKLRIGDMVKFDRGWYSHWGVYVGEEAIIHLVGEDNDGINGQVNSGHFFTICGKNFNKANVKLDSFWNVAGETKAYKNNDKDRKCSPKDAEKIVETALKKLGTIGYNVLWNNCEHFAAFCRYGVKWSEQANTFLKCVMGICAGIIGIGIANELTSKKEEEN